MSTNFTIKVLSSVSTGATSGYFVLPGDFSAIFYPGYQFTFKGIGLLNQLYTTVSAVYSGDTTQVNVATAVIGSIVTIGTFTQGTGIYLDAPVHPKVYNNVPLSGGTGNGATATVTVSGPGPINAFGTFTGGGSYTPGAYTVPLTGGTGAGATAQVVVYPSGAVGSVNIVVPGTGYSVGDALVASTGTIPGIGGAGFTVVVDQVLGNLASVVLLNPGVAYSQGDVLSFGGYGFGLNNTVPVTAVTTSDVGTITIPSTIPMFKYGQNVFCIVETAGVWGASGSTSGGTYFGSWSWFGSDGWDWLNPIGPFVISPMMQVPAVQSGQILQVLVTTNDSSLTPKVTYQIRLQGQTGVTMLDESMVFVDKPTAITAYSAIVQ